MKSDDSKKRYTYRAGDNVSPTPETSQRGSLYREEHSRRATTEQPPAQQSARYAPASGAGANRQTHGTPGERGYAAQQPVYDAPPPQTPVYSEATYTEPVYRDEPAYPAEDTLYPDDIPYDGNTSYTDIRAYSGYAGVDSVGDGSVPSPGESEYNEFGYGEYAAAGEGYADDYGTIINRDPSKPLYDLDHFAQNGRGEEARGREARSARAQGEPRAPRAEMPRRKSTRERGARDGKSGRRAAYAGGHGGQVSTGRKIGRYVGRGFAVAGVVVAAVVIFAFALITMICKSPFTTVKEKFVVSVTETSAVKWLANIYFSPEEVEAILASNAVLPPEETTDTTTPFEAGVNEETKQDIEIVDIKGPTYVGKLMIINDPTRIRLATLPAFGENIDGKKVEDFVAENNAVAGINAGGFLDLNGMGRGGQPLGMLIKDGVILSGSPSTSCNMIGFTAEGQLLVGVMTGQEALDKGMMDGVYFDPTLIVNGQPAEVSGNGGGLNPRTVIGQREDGAVLMLVIDGRQPHSLGASLQDCMQEMLNAGAVNASNLDGGSSSVMIYEGEMINTCASLYGSRGQPACWIVQ